MSELDAMIEKYRRDMLGYSSRSRYAEEQEEESEASDLIENGEQTADTENRTSEVETIPESYGKTVSDTDKTGALKVMVFAGNEAFPLPAARVQVYDDRETELYTVFTDGNGIAENISLPAPDRNNTDYPGEPVGYALYKVKVSHPDYETAVFRDVQIYDGIESVQDAYLLPPSGEEKADA